MCTTGVDLLEAKNAHITPTKFLPLITVSNPKAWSKIFLPSENWVARILAACPNPQATRPPAKNSMVDGFLEKNNKKPVMDSSPHKDFEGGIDNRSTHQKQFAKIATEYVSFLFTSDRVMRTYNKHYRGLDKPTNVLSFDMGPSADGIPTLRGDIIVAFETIRRESTMLGCPFHHHLTHMVVHGLLHLLGYDHQNAKDEKLMQAEEIRILKALSLPSPYPDKDPAQQAGNCT